MFVHVLYENPDWMPPLRDALASRQLAWREHVVVGGHLDLSVPPAAGVYVNRMSPSAHTRDHQGGVRFMKEYLAYLEAYGRTVINGTEAFALEVSKVRQDVALRAAGIHTPRTLAIVGQDPKAAARRMQTPFITKHNQGGKGLGVQLFRSHDAFDAAVDAGEIQPSPDGVLLLQQYIEPASPFITRVEIVDGAFLYAIKSSTEGGFELCPADACATNDDFCPVGGTGTFSVREDITADDPLVQRYIAFMARHNLRVAGIEFVEDAQGNRFTYDINGTTNFNAELEAEHGLHGMGAIADLCARELGRRTVVRAVA